MSELGDMMMRKLGTVTAVHHFLCFFFRYFQHEQKDSSMNHCKFFYLRDESKNLQNIFHHIV